MLSIPTDVRPPLPPRGIVAARSAATTDTLVDTPSGAGSATLADVGVELRLLVRRVDEACDGDVPPAAFGPLLRLVDELAAATCGRPVRRSEAASAAWVLVQRAADHFGRATSGGVDGRRAAPTSLCHALEDARRAVRLLAC